MSSGAVWTEGISLPLDFAVHLLQRDGLRVPPFDQHSPGDRSLRGLGLDGPSWLGWLNALARREKELNASATELVVPATASAARQFGAQLRLTREQPWTCFPGGAEIRASLAALWPGYVGEAVQWAETLARARQHDRVAPEHERALQHAFQRFRGLGPVSVFIVRYPSPAALAIPPETCLVGVGAAQDHGRTFVRQVEAGVRLLAAAQA